MQVFHQVHNRGGERVALDIESGLQSRGHQVNTVAVKRRDPDGEVAAVVKDVQVFSEQQKPSNTPLAMLRLFAFLARERPDSVIIHTTAAGFTVAPIAFLLGIKQRILVHHNAIGTNQDGVWVHLEKLYGTAGVYSDIVFVSDRAHELVADWPSRYRKRAEVIFNGIALPEPAPHLDRQKLLERYDLSPDTLLTLSVGSLERQKNQKVLVEALEGVSGAHLFIAGEGSLRSDLERDIKERGSSVTLLGNIEISEVSALFRSCDVLLFPSIHEGRALSLLEAADSGIGIIASSIPENISVLGDDGRYVGPHDSAGWRSEIQTLVEDPTEVDERRRHTKSLSLHSLEEMVDNYERLI